MSDDDLFEKTPPFTDEDYQYIDRICEEAGTWVKKGAPRIFVEVERSTDKEKKEDNHPGEPRESPFTLFRERGYLTVSDIVSPAWCEVQFDYGLQQHRNKPLKRRPGSFVTKKGNTIKVDKKVASLNDKTLAKGKKVHRALEKEVHKKELIIETMSVEESWALRLLDTLSRLETLKEKHVCREIPVWGVIHNEAISGVIDELLLTQRKPVPESREQIPAGSSSTSPITKKRRLDWQAEPDALPVSKDKASPPPTEMPRPVFGETSTTIRILDNKTRKSRGLPSHNDTLPSRLQLMLYWRLLRQVLSFDPDIFRNFCSRLGLNLKLPFSKSFQANMSALVINNKLSLNFLDADCLDSMVVPYAESIIEMDMSYNVSQNLSLVYRLRGEQTKGLIRSSDANNASSAPAVAREAPESSDIPISTDDAKVVPPVDADIDVAESMISRPLSAPRVEGSSLKRKREDSRSPETLTAIDVDNSCSSSADGDASGAEAGAKGAPAEVRPLTSSVIGTKRFPYNPKFLDEYLSNVLSWWHGKRPPRGVDVENAYRCSSCEYRDGCEWREQKASEFLAKATHVPFVPADA
ncbi:hypothetical protein M0805_005847 [Coniferiporia weirii]|nr:hypothetical protein M0805_005847 [Coniferiporia weirii]